MSPTPFFQDRSQQVSGTITVSVKNITIFDTNKLINKIDNVKNYHNCDMIHVTKKHYSVILFYFLTCIVSKKNLN